MQLVMTRITASRLAEALDLGVRLALGQWDRLHEVLSTYHMEPRVRDDPRLLAMDEDIRTYLQFACYQMMELAPGTSYGIFSTQVAPRIRELNALKIMLQKAVAGGASVPAYEHVVVGGALIAYDVLIKEGAVVSVGTLLGDIAERHCLLRWEDHELRVVPNSLIEMNRETVWINLTLPCVREDASLLADIADVAKLYSVLWHGELFQREGLVSLAHWMQRDPKSAVGRIPRKRVEELARRLEERIGRLLSLTA